MKILLLLILTIITSCKVLQDKYLYDEDSPGYGTLEEAAAKECVDNNEIFSNLKADSFLDYSILSDDNYIKLSEDYYIWIQTVTADSVQFTVISDESDTFSSFLFQKTYSISRTENNSVVDMLAEGVCANKFFKGTPSSSTNQLSFSVSNYNIEDSTDENSDTEPGEYNLRQDTIVMNSATAPAFLFIWGASYKSYSKQDGDSQQDASFVNLELSITDSNKAACVEKFGTSQCENDSVVEVLDIDTSAFNNTRETNSDDALKRYYFTNFP